jgi:hypothetical protein
MSTEMNRRAVLAGAAALPATALPAIATDGPIHKVIDELVAD